MVPSADPAPTRYILDSCDLARNGGWRACAGQPHACMTPNRTPVDAACVLGTDKHNKGGWSCFFVWKCGLTWGGRYDELGIPCIIDSYSKEKSITSLRTIDVGCSKGVAIKNCQRLLVARGVWLDTVGIDQSSKVRKSAEKNLNRFILSNVLHVENCDNTADVVVCANMLRHGVSSVEKSQVVKKCADFLKPAGILILMSPFPNQFGRCPEKGGLIPYDMAMWRRFMNLLLPTPQYLLKEIKILSKAEAEGLSKCVIYE